MNPDLNIPIKRKPHIRLSHSSGHRFINSVLKKHELNTVCEEARCPNIYECWSRRTATIMILGNVCTRSCGFCSVKTGKPASVDIDEPRRTAQAVKYMGLKHVVITSVDRDDLRDDYGSGNWAETVSRIHEQVPECTVEVLTPDFHGYRPAIQTVLKTHPDIFSHNIECVERISRRVRVQTNWQRSLEVLTQSVEFGLLTKTGLIVGLGETFRELVNTMKQVAQLGVKIFTIGQYLQPTKYHLPVERYVPLSEFKQYKEIGLDLGFAIVESGPLVRSSYHADEQARILINN